MTIGTEHEFSINDPQFNPLPVSDTILKTICGRYESEILFGDVKLGKELQKTVLEMVPRTHADTIAVLEEQLMRGIRKFSQVFRDRYQLLGLGMHPTLTLDQTAVWDHDEGEYYEAYDRLFNIRQHGWLNIQALQVNLSYSGEKDLVLHYNRLRSLLPYLIAVTAASPIVEGKSTGTADNRLLYYRENQKEIPLICNRIIPEKIGSVQDYRREQEEIFAELQETGCGNPLRGVGELGRASSSASPGSVSRSRRSTSRTASAPTWRSAPSSVRSCGARPCPSRPTRMHCWRSRRTRSGRGRQGSARNSGSSIPGMGACNAGGAAVPARSSRNRIEHGSLAEIVRERFEREREIVPILADLALALKTNVPVPTDDTRSHVSNPHKPAHLYSVSIQDRDRIPWHASYSRKRKAMNC